MLADEFIFPFMYDGNQWYSITHYALAQKYKEADPETYASFTLDSGSDIGANVRSAKRADPHYAYGVDLSGPLMIKFNDKELKKVLLNTGDATLVEYVSRKPGIIRNDIMKIRDKLRKDSIVKNPEPILEPRAVPQSSNKEESESTLGCT